MKYIDADRLRAEIEKRKQIHFDDYFIKKSGNPADYGASNALAQVLSLIDSLQQEQPQGLHFTPLNRLIQKIPSENWNDTVNNYAKKLCDCLINEGFRKDAEVLQGYISYMNGNNVPMATMDEQEHPDVDIEKELISYYNKHFSPCEDGVLLSEESGGELKRYDYESIARHFYSLGLKVNNDAVIEKACEWLKNNVTYTHPRTGETKCVVNLNAFIDAMKG